MRPAAAAAIGLLALGLLGAGCSRTHVPPTAPPPPTGEDPAAGDGEVAPDRVLVVNTLSETLSSLDPDTGDMTVQAAVAGAWVNRIAPGTRARRLLVTNSGANEVVVLDALDLSTVARIDLGAGRSPWTAIAAGRSRILVTNWLAGTVRLASPAGLLVGPPLDTTPGPEGVVIRNGRAFVAGTNYRSDDSFGPGHVDVLHLDTWTVTASIPVGSNPQDLAFAPDGRLHVVCTGSVAGGAGSGEGTVHVIDPSTLHVEDVLAIGGSPGRIVSDTSGVMWTAGFSGGLRRYDAATLTRLEDPPDPALRGSGWSAIAHDPVRDALYATHFDNDLLLELDAASATIREMWLVGDGPVDVLVHRSASSSR